jgi:hypothetical protein
MPDQTAEMLEQVNAAITAVLTRGQEVTINGKRYSRADLGELRQMRTDLEREVRRGAGPGMRIRRVVPRG